MVLVVSHPRSILRGEPRSSASRRELHLAQGQLVAENKNEAFLRRYPAIPGYPHFFVLDGNGRLAWSQNTSELEAKKNYDPAAMHAFLVKWAPKR